MVEITLFHPLDTINKRLMARREFISSDTWRQILFEEAAHGSATRGGGGGLACSVIVGNRSGQQSLAWSRAASLFLPGLCHAYFYKVLQRSYQFTMQHGVKTLCFERFRPASKRARTMTEGLAGAVMGCMEAVLMPLNTLKVRSQTNPEFRGRTPLDGLQRALELGGMRKLYAGWEWTIMRNTPGSFAMFGMNAAVKEYVFGLADYTRDASFVQNLVSSACGSVASLVVSSPFDVVKTRIQSGLFVRPDGSQMSGWPIAQLVWRQEGPAGFLKGCLTKCFTTGVKLTVSFGLAQSAIGHFEERLHATGSRLVG